MAIKPILFNTEMVRAILDGRKSCTRRLVKIQPKDNEYTVVFTRKDVQIKTEKTTAKSPYQVGDILYVRETWMDYAGRTMYRADCDKYRLENLKLAEFSWKPSIHMPKEAARIWLKVTDVRVERLQEITIDDIRNEGLSSMAVHAGDMEIAIEEWKNLWNSTIKKSDLDRYGWDANPYVWVIEFERCEKPKGV